MVGNLQKQVADLARQYEAEKVVYQHRGTSRRGCDCTGLIIGILQEIGLLQNYQLRPYPPDWNLHAAAGNQIIEELEIIAEPIEKHQALRGDIAVIFWGRCPAHCGVIVQGPANPMMVHAYYTAGRCKYAMLTNSPWAKRWRSAWRLSERKLGYVQ